MASEVNRLLQQQQTGEYVPTKEEQDAMSSVATNSNDNPPQPKMRAIDLFRIPERGYMVQESLGMEAAAEGYGKSVYDTYRFSPDVDVEHKRAVAQSGAWKVANGTIKGGIVAATTAVNTVVGIIDGLLEGTYELVREASEGETISGPKIVGAGVDNFTSRTMADIQRLSDEWFPNYRTQEERSERYQQEWIKHIFTPNFIGDSFLKNFGFTVGSIIGGAVWAKALGMALSGTMSANLMKGVTAAAEGDEIAANALKNVLGTVQSGSAVAIDNAQIAKNIATAAKQTNKFGTKTQLFGSVIAAMGEGTFEGITAKNEFMDKCLPELNSDFITQYKNLEQSIIEEEKKAGHSTLLKYVPKANAEGMIELVPELNDKGKARLYREQQLLADKYKARRDFMDEQGDRLAATTFMLNLPILTISDTAQFGRMLSGGWKTSRGTLSKLVGGIKSNGATMGAEYSAAGSVLGKTLAGIAKVGGTEASEEMLQGAISSGAKKVADNRIASFNNDGYDPEVMRSYGEWFKGMFTGASEYLSDWKNWQEGFMGLVTGLVGLPGSGRWNGGVAEAYRNAAEDQATAEKAASLLNDRVNSEKFQNAWKSYVRHMKYENEMEDALTKNDKYAWITANDKQLVNDVMMFADAGRLQDLTDLVDMYASMSDADAEQKGVTEAVTSEDNKTEIDNNPAQAIEKVREQARDIKDVIGQYNNIYNDISTIVPIGTSKEQIAEMTATAMNIKRYEKRYLEMLDDVITRIEPAISSIATISKDGSKFEDSKQALDRAKQIRSALASYFTNVTIPSSFDIDKLGDVVSVLDAVEENKQLVSEETKTLLDDMRKVHEDRADFIRKFLTLKYMPTEEFVEKVDTPAELATKAKDEVVKKEMSSLTSFDSIHNGYFEKDAKGRADFLQGLSAIEDTNPNAKEFLQMIRLNDGFNAYLNQGGVNVSNVTVTPPMVQSVLTDIVHRARGLDDIKNLPDRVFPSYAEFARDFTSIFGVPQPEALQDIKNAIRQAMKDYLTEESATSSRNLIDADANTNLNMEDVSVPDGYDAAQPGSLVEAPVKLPDWMTTEEATHSEPEEPAQSEQPESSEEITRDEVSDPTAEQLLDDAAIVTEDNSAEAIADEKIHVPGEKDKIFYYRTSVPEISSKEAEAARSALLNRDRETLQKANLSDFPVLEPGYSTIWNALNERNAFANVATRLEEGDAIEFVVDPNFPQYKGQYQILLTTVKNGERLVLNILSQQASKYHNLASLRDAIDEEYRSFIEEHPNEMFVFSKKSKVWVKRAGLIDYDFNQQHEKGVIDIPGYDDKATIAFIDRNGIARNVRGSAYPMDNVSLSFTDTQYNRDNARRGNLYYLTKTAKDKWIPIRLNVEHFNETTKDYDNPTFNAIRERVANIVSIVKDSNENNLEGQNKKLRDEMSALTDKLDTHDIFFEVGNFNNVGVALRVSSPSIEGFLRRNDQIDEDWLTNTLAGFNRSIQIRLDRNGKLEHLDEYIDQGVITSNARLLRPKGVDFYFKPWDSNTNQFYDTARTLAEIETESNRSESELDSYKGLDAMNGNFDLGDRDDLFGAVSPVPEVSGITSRMSDSDVRNILGIRSSDDATVQYIHSKFVDLPQNIQAMLSKKGYTADEYDNMSDLEKDKIIRCISI